MFDRVSQVILDWASAGLPYLFTAAGLVFASFILVLMYYSFRGE